MKQLQFHVTGATSQIVLLILQSHKGKLVGDCSMTKMIANVCNEL